MATNPPLRLLLLVVGASVLAADATAVTLGRARGAVLIGRPLELAIGVTPDTPGGEVPCLSGEAFYGDRRIQPPPSVRIEAAGRDPVIRFSSPSPVDEPMVTIYVRAGCGQGFTKRFVLLSELPPENEPAAPLVTQSRAAPSLSPLAPSAGATGPVAASRGVEGEPLPALRPSRSSAAESRARRARASADAAATAPSPAAPGAPAPAPTVAAPTARPSREAPAAVSMSPRLTPRLGAATPRGRPGNRLRLEPLDLLTGTSPTLPLSNQLTLPANPDGDPQARAKAQALWQSLVRTPDEIAQDNLRLQSIETEMKSLREATKQNAATLDVMRQQVEKARSERNQVTMIALALGALLFAAGAWLAWRWRSERRRSSERWFTGGEVESDLADLDSRQAAPAKTPAKPLASAPPSDVVSRPADVPRSAFRPDITSPVRVQPEASPAPRGRSEPDSAFDFQASQGGSIRMVRVDELIDVQDKAQFFMSIGEKDQAVAVLESHLHDHAETSALAWLDLLDLYHSLDKRAEFDRLRTEFRQQFNAQVPEFDEFDQQSGGLEDYGRALSRIVALWPSPRVLEVIEESVFRRPGVGGADAFSLEAYRDLILLYNIAREVIPQGQGGDGEDSTGTFTSTSVQPLAPWAAPEPAEEAFDPRLVPPISRNIGVDIELDEPEASANDDPTVVLPARGAAPTPSPAPEAMISSFGALDFDTSFDDIDPPKIIKGK